MRLEVIIGIGVLAAFGMWLFRRRRTRWPAPGCGQCGYPAAGLERLICPECGSDLARVGILDASPPRGDLVRTIVLYALAVAVIGITCTQLLYLSVPALRQQQSVLTMNGTSGQFTQIAIEATGPIVDDVARFTRARVRLRGGPAAAPVLDVPLTVLIESSPWHGGGRGDGKSAQRSWDEIARWLSSSGIDLGEPKAREDAMLAADWLVSFAFVGRRGGGSGSFSNGIRTLSWTGQSRWLYWLVVLGFWLLVGVGGCAAILQIHRTCRAEHAAMEMER